MGLERLRQLALRYGLEEVPKIPRLSVYRRDMASDVEATVYDPVLCLILQGAKVTSVGEWIVELTSGDALLVSHDLPVVSRITQASPANPYLALILSLDLTLLRGLHDQLGGRAEESAAPHALCSGAADPAWLAPLTRYMELTDSPQDANVLGSATLREIHYRLLVSPMGGTLRNLLVADGHATRIARAIQELRTSFRGPLSVAQLARTAGMSTSSFHEHFKAVTGTTPLQYQKDLRLIEARALLVGGGHGVSDAAFSVGYESPTHFSRDYRRKFGLPPSRARDRAA